MTESPMEMQIEINRRLAAVVEDLSHHIAVEQSVSTILAVVLANKGLLGPEIFEALRESAPPADGKIRLEKFSALLNARADAIQGTVRKFTPVKPA